MKMYKLKLKLLAICVLLLFSTFDSFSQRVYNNNQLLKKGLEAAYYLNKGDEYSLRRFLTEREGLVLDTQNSKSDLLVFAKQLQNPITEPEGAVQFIAIVVDKTTKDHRIQVLYSHQENGKMYNLNSSFLNDLKYNNLFFEGNNGMYAYMKGGQKNNIESMKFICGVVPNYLLDMISFQVFLLHNKGNYPLDELLKDFN